MINESELSLLDSHNDNYGLSQFVFINSGSNAHVELPLDESLAITMCNNGGKSANLRALKLLLLPEVNFKSSRKKFDFEAADGTVYADEDSFRYYFPSDRSFIIAEVFNPHRSGSKHCQVLMRARSKQLGYQRWFVPVAFKELQSLFFDAGSKENRGLGEPTYITEEEANTQFKLLGGRLATEKGDIKKLLFSTYNPGNPDSFYSLFPMADTPTDDHIEAFKTLIHLAFNMKVGDNSSVIKAVAAILSRKVTDDAKFKVDIGKIPEEAHELFVEKSRLDTMLNLQPRWEDTVAIWRKATSAVDRSMDSYAIIKSSFDAHTEEFSGVMDNINREYNEKDLKLQDIKRDLKIITDRASQAKGALKSKELDIESLEKSLEKADELRVAYSSLNCVTDQQIADVIEGAEYEGIAAYTKLIKTLENKTSIERELTEEIQKKKTIGRKISELKGIVNDVGLNITSSLSVFSASVITTLMPGLRTAALELDDESKDKITGFTDLFHIPDNTTELHFLNCNLANLKYRTFDKNEMMADANLSLTHEIKRLDQCETRLGDLNKELRDSDAGNTGRIEKLKELRAEAVAEKAVILDANTNKNTLEKYKETYAEYKENAEKIDFRKIELGMMKEEASGLLHEVRERRITVQNTYKTQKNNEKSLKDTQNNLHKIVGEDPDSWSMGVAGEILTHAVMTDEIEKVNFEIRSILDCVDSLRDDLEKMGRERCIDLIQFLPDGVARATLGSMHSALTALSGEFNALDTHLENHTHRVVAHNHETSSQVTVIRDIIRQVDYFETELNSDLAGIKISDLSGIKIELVKRKLFTELASDLEYQIKGGEQEVLQSTAFYGRIQEFCDKVITGGSGQISMEEIVESIRWNLKKNGVEDKTAQSNGTQGLLNATLMMLLLKNMMQDHVSVRLPIIFDEVNKLDSQNLRTLRVAAESRGFILLVATPETTGQIISEFPVINLGLWELEKVPTNIKQCCVIYNGEAERMTKIEVDDGQ
jgi:hypothetical protein